MYSKMVTLLSKLKKSFFFLLHIFQKETIKFTRN